MDCDAFFMDPARTIDSVIAMYSPLVSKAIGFVSLFFVATLQWFDQECADSPCGYDWKKIPGIDMNGYQPVEGQLDWD